MKMLMGSDDYPEHYWLKYDRDANPDYFKFSGGERCEGISKALKFHLKGRVSMSSFSQYDFLSSDGPDVMTEKLARILENACPAGIQLVPAEVISNGKAWSGYYVVNILNIDKAFDMDRCVYCPLLKSMPEGPKKFERIRLLSSRPEPRRFGKLIETARVFWVKNHKAQFTRVHYTHNGVPLFTIHAVHSHCHYRLKSAHNVRYDRV